MSTDFHSPIPSSPSQEARAATFNTRFGTLDAAIGDAMSFGLSNNSELATARFPYSSLNARLNSITGGYVGGNIATTTNGAANASQKVVTVLSTTGFIARAVVAYLLVSGETEYNLIDTVDSPTQLTLVTNIGATGIASGVYIGMISVSEYQAANAIPHAGSLTMPQAMVFANGGVYNVMAYGASPSASAAVNAAAVKAAYDAVYAAGGGTIHIGPGTFAMAHLDISHGAGQSLTKHVRITGDNSQATVLEFDTTGVCIDAVSCEGLQLENLAIMAKAGTTPTIGLLLGRTAAAANCRYGSFKNIRIEGDFSQACVASIASEIQHWDTCFFQNNHANGVAFATSTQPTMMRSDGAGGWESFTVASTHGTLMESSNTDNTFTKCVFFAGGAYGIPFSAEAGLQATFIGCDFDPWGANTPACVLLSAEHNDVFAGPLVFLGCLFESNDAHGIVLLAETGSATKEFRFVKVLSCYFNLYGTGQYSVTWDGALTNQAIALTGWSYHGNARPTLANDTIRVNYLQECDNITVPAGTIVLESNGAASAAIIRSPINAKTYNYASGPNFVNIVETKRYFYASAKPTSGGYVKGDVIWNSSPDEGEPIGWICRVSGGLYDHTRGNTTSYTVGEWLEMNASPYSVWEITAGAGNTGAAPPSQAGAIGSTVADGDFTLTKRAGTAAYLGEFGRQVGYRSGSATPAGSVTPTHVGEDYLDSTAVKWYKATGLTSSDWVALN